MQPANPATNSAWRSQLVIGILVLNWLYQDEADRADLTALAGLLVTSEQRRLQLHRRWAERDRAALEGPGEPDNAFSGLAARTVHTAWASTRRGRGRREAWRLSEPI